MIGRTGERVSRAAHRGGDPAHAVPHRGPTVDDEPFPEPPPWWRRRGRRRRAMPLWQELPLLLLVAFCLAVLIRTFLLQAFYIPSGSMETTLLVGDRVLVNKIVYDMRDPQRGEVVVFRGTDKWAPEARAAQSTGLVSRISRTIGDLVGLSQPGEKDFIKRVIGLPGDTVQCCDDGGNVLVNGVPLDEQVYLPEARNSPSDQAPVPGQCGSRTFAPVVVPPGQIFVMGDHRLVSQDSRCQGPVPIKNVIGRAIAVVWPNDHWHGLPVPGTFVNNKPGALGGPGVAGVSGAPSVSGGVAGSGAVSVSGGVDAGRGTGAGWAFVLPFLASLAAPARSRRRLWRPHSRLLE
jgi:signal peptidase I